MYSFAFGRLLNCWTALLMVAFSDAVNVLFTSQRILIVVEGIHVVVSQLPAGSMLTHALAGAATMPKMMPAPIVALTETE